MQMKRMNGEITIVGHDRLYILAEVESGINTAGWISLGGVGDSGRLMIDRDDWDSFKELVAEVDSVVQAREQAE
jgi:hypothetical protein